jgi:hypothetical protein
VPRLKMTKIICNGDNAGEMKKEEIEKEVMS